jgi:hypothetical protein
MRSLDILDLLVGGRCPAKGHMARSTLVPEGGRGPRRRRRRPAGWPLGLGPLASVVSCTCTLHVHADSRRAGTGWGWAAAVAAAPCSRLCLRLGFPGQLV